MNKTYCWLTSSLERIFKKTPPEANKYLSLFLAQNDKGSFQACISNQEQEAVKVNIAIDCPDNLTVNIRRVGHVPVPHFNTNTDINEVDGKDNIPGYVPDPLFDDLEMEIPAGESGSYWISIETTADTPAISYPINVHIQKDNETVFKASAEVRVCPVTLEKNTQIPITHWFYADALCDWYHLQPFTGDFWDIARSYIKDMVNHGVNVMHSPLFTPPTDGVKRPNQLLKIKVDDEGDKKKYKFDWSHVRKWIEMARSCGMEYFEWPHLFTQWGIENAVRIYENYDGNYQDRLLWPPATAADSKVYRNFLAQFLPQFKEFLQEEGILNKSFFHLSDEPHGDEHLQNYRRAREILRDLAPWMEIMDALSQVDYAGEGLTDMPIASIKSSEEFREAEIPHWDYFCCGPRGPYLNRLLDTPLPKIRGAGWLFYALGARGFLHWGYNYWYKSQTRELINPYFEQDGLHWPGWAYGDPFVVYPGEDGPIDSIRWEIFGESLKDYNLLYALNLNRNDNYLSPFVSYKDYPKKADWYQSNRALLLMQNCGD